MSDASAAISDSTSADEQADLVALARRLQEIFIERGLTLATAESCTGGLIGHVLTEVPGVSDYYAGGLISYSNEVKQSGLGVDPHILETHGAVSAQTCVAMAEGARQRFGVSHAISVTGIAGPGGGSDSKPVGLTYVGVADANGHDVRRNIWQSDRHKNKLLSARAALELLLERLA
ncbi:MAG TPA: CinA family protein [Candidatus Limnocylindrales bacterium]|nr:CinA family protein [Candidatus Limnocylindrales bacterium]